MKGNDKGSNSRQEPSVRWDELRRRSQVVISIAGGLLLGAIVMATLAGINAGFDLGWDFATRAWIIVMAVYTGLLLAVGLVAARGVDAVRRGDAEGGRWLIGALRTGIVGWLKDARVLRASKSESKGEPQEQEQVGWSASLGRKVARITMVLLALIMAAIVVALLAFNLDTSEGFANPGVATVLSLTAALAVVGVVWGVAISGSWKVVVQELLKGLRGLVAFVGSSFAGAYAVLLYEGVVDDPAVIGLVVATMVIILATIEAARRLVGWLFASLNAPGHVQDLRVSSTNEVELVDSSTERTARHVLVAKHKGGEHGVDLMPVKPKRKGESSRAA